MLNQVVLVGRLTKGIELKEEGEKKKAHIELAVSRSIKDADGEYDTDFIDCTLWNAVAENTAEYCKQGDILGVKGRIQTEIIDDVKQTSIIAEKVTFLSTCKPEDK
jgi:single-strand DNA-binding protein